MHSFTFVIFKFITLINGCYFQYVCDKHFYAKHSIDLHIRIHLQLLFNWAYALKAQFKYNSDHLLRFFLSIIFFVYYKNLLYFYFLITIIIWFEVSWAVFKSKKVAYIIFNILKMKHLAFRFKRFDSQWRKDNSIW